MKRIKNIVVVIAALTGIWAMIFMFKSGMLCEFDKSYSEGSLPALLCPAPSHSSSLR